MRGLGKNQTPHSRGKDPQDPPSAELVPRNRNLPEMRGLSKNSPPHFKHSSSSPSRSTVETSPENYPLVRGLSTNSPPRGSSKTNTSGRDSASNNLPEMRGLGKNIRPPRLGSAPSGLQSDSSNHSSSPATSSPVQQTHPERSGWRKKRAAKASPCTCTRPIVDRERSTQIVMLRGLAKNRHLTLQTATIVEEQLPSFDDADDATGQLWAVDSADQREENMEDETDGDLTKADTAFLDGISD